MQRSIGSLLAVLFGIWASTVASAYGAAGDDVKWLVVYEGGALPAAPQWTRQGGGVPTSVTDGAMRLVDDSAESFGCYRASFSADPADEIVVEARVRVVSLPDGGDGGLIWPWRDGVPAGILVSDGRHQEGLVLRPTRIATFMDRFHAMDATDKFHDYRLVIRGNDMSVYVDGQLRIRGQDAFWKPATEAKPFIQFGSNSAKHRGESRWEYVKLGVRPAGQAEAKPKLKITVGEPWNVSKQGVAAQTRPYLYNVGKGLLLMSVAQGPDALYEPYGVLKSTDEGKTWSFVEGMREKVFAPQPMTRMQDGSILGASRWMTHYVGDNGVHAGITYHFDPNVESHRMFESKIVLPNEVSNTAAVCDRDIFNLEDGSVVIVIYGSPGRLSGENDGSRADLGILCDHRQERGTGVRRTRRGQNLRQGVDGRLATRFHGRPASGLVARWRKDLGPARGPRGRQRRSKPDCHEQRRLGVQLRAARLLHHVQRRSGEDLGLPPGDQRSGRLQLYGDLRGPSGAAPVRSRRPEFDRALLRRREGE